MDRCLSYMWLHNDSPHITSHAHTSMLQLKELLRINLPIFPPCESWFTEISCGLTCISNNSLARTQWHTTLSGNAATLQPQMQAFVDTVLHGIKVKNTVQGEVLVAKAIYKSMQAKKFERTTHENLIGTESNWWRRNYTCAFSIHEDDSICVPWIMKVRNTVVSAQQLLQWVLVMFVC